MGWNAIGPANPLQEGYGEGMLYSAMEIETWLREAGFTSTSRQHLPMEHVLIEAVR